MLHKTRAIVLKSFKHGESGIIVQVFTEEFGRQSIIIHSVRKKKGKFNSTLFNSLSLVNLDIYYKENRDIQTIKEVKPGVIQLKVFSDIKRSSIAIFIGEILFRTLKEVEPNKQLFEFVYNAVQILEIAEKGIEYFHLLFLIQFSKFLGIYPIHDETLRNILLKKGIDFGQFVQYTFSDMEYIGIDRNNRLELLNWFIKYYQQNLDGIGEIKSLPILQEIFQ